MPAIPPILDQLSALSDPVRARLATVLDGREVTVSELVAITQLPQSTVSRHLRVLADQGWVGSRAEGTSRWYRLDPALLDPAAAAVWASLRESLGGSPTAREDARRLGEAIRARRTRSREFFSGAAARWDRLREELYGPRATWPALAALADPTWIVGDLGCGTGELSDRLAPFVAQVIAIDAERTMLDAAAARLGGVTNVEFRQGELEALPVADAALDAAMLVLVLHHVPDPTRVLREARRALRPGAALVVVDMVPHDREEFRDEMGHQWLGFSDRDMRRLLDDAGFTRDSLRYHALPMDPRGRGPGLFIAAARCLDRAAAPQARPVNPQPRTTP